MRSALAAIDYTSQEIIATRQRVEVNELALKLSKDRFFSGVSDNLELVAAQAALADSRALYTRALGRYNTARVKLAIALGIIQGFEL